MNGQHITNRHRAIALRAYTLVELVLVMGLLVAISAITIPNFVRQIERETLPGSAKQLRSFITLVRANAAFDGLRYRIRFPLMDENREGEEYLLNGRYQPIIEREDDPIHQPEVFNPVTAPWAIGKTFLGDVWCAEVRPGRPSIEKLQQLRQTRSDIQDALTEAFDQEQKNFEAERPPLIIESDGTCEWVTFVITEAPEGTELESLEDFPSIDVILDGETGLAWLQRPFFEEELDLFEEKNWPAVLRQDFLNPNPLTENDVLELHDVYHGRNANAKADTNATEP